MPQRLVLGMRHAMSAEEGKREVSSISGTLRSSRMVAIPWGKVACLQASLGEKINPGDQAQWCYCWLSSCIALKHYCSLRNTAGAGWLVLCLTRFRCAMRTSTGTGSLSQCGVESHNSVAEHPPKTKGWAHPPDGNGLPSFPAALLLKPKADNCHGVFGMHSMQFWSHKSLGESLDLPLKLLELFMACLGDVSNVAGVGGCQCSGQPVPSGEDRNHCPIAPIETWSKKIRISYKPWKKGWGQGRKI